VSFPDPGRAGAGVSVIVIVRAKPPAPADSPVIVSMTKKSATITLPGRARLHRKEEDVRTFTFDRCYWSASRADPNYASQELVFSEVGGYDRGEARAWRNACKGKREEGAGGRQPGCDDGGAGCAQPCGCVLLAAM
jgi:hypothetical protein